MSDYWQQKVALVTGGSRGLGRSIASALAAAGAKVVIAARDTDVLARTASELRSGGADVLAVPADVTDSVQVDALVRQAIERYGRLDALVNNAGQSSRGEILATTADAFRDSLAINFMSVVHATRAAAPHLLKSGGHLVNIGSLAAKTAAPFLGPYPASKFAVAAYCQQLRLELGPQGLHVLLVCPGPILRTDDGSRYAAQTAGLPRSAQKPGGGAKLRGIAPAKLSQKILRYCERRKPELVMPAKARLLFTLAQLSPSLGDWIVRRMTQDG